MARQRTRLARRRTALLVLLVLACALIALVAAPARAAEDVAAEVQPDMDDTAVAAEEEYADVPAEESPDDEDPAEPEVDPEADAKAEAEREAVEAASQEAAEKEAAEQAAKEAAEREAAEQAERERLEREQAEREREERERAERERAEREKAEKEAAEKAAKEEAARREAEEKAAAIANMPEIAVKEIRLRVAAADGTMGEVQKISYPDKFSKEITVGAPGALKIGFKVYDAKKDDKAALSVNQAVFVLTNRETKQDTTFVAEAPKVGTYALDIDLSSMSVLQSLNYQGGVYDMTLILGSFSAKSGLSYPIGAVRIALPKPDETGYVAGPKAGPAGAGAQDPADYAVKPEIRHVFRPDAKQAPFVVSATFTGVVFVPWLVLLIGWQQLGFGVPLLTRLSFVTQSLFAAAILALPAIMFLYWTAWNLFQLLPYLAGWGVYAFYTGRRALREHAAFRAKNESGKAKKSE